MNDDHERTGSPPRVVRATTSEAKALRARQFAELFTEHGSITKTAAAAGASRQHVAAVLRSPEGQTAMQEVRYELNALQKQRLAGLSDLALDALEDTLRRARPESMAKTNAAQAVLDRSGHRPVERSEVLLDAKITDESRASRIAAILETARSRRTGSITDGGTGAG